MSKTFRDYGIDVEPGRRGEFDALCPKCSHGRRPEHQRHKCLSVNADKGIWQCHNCGWKGGIPPEKDWRKEYVAPKEYTRPKLIDEGRTEVANTFLAARGISEKVADRNEVIATDAQFQFPLRRGGELLTIKTRGIADKTFGLTEKADQIPMGWDDAYGQPVVIIVEGEFDKLAIEEATGWEYVISPPNGSNPSDQVMEYMVDICKLSEKVILAGDMDKVGQEFMDKIAKRIGFAKCFKAVWPEKDANDTLLAHGARRVRECLNDAKAFPVAGIISMDDLSDEVDRLYEDGMPGGDSTGWKSLDRHYTVRRGQMTVLTGSPGSGKALAIDTPIPTPFGWTTMGELQVGDWVFDEDGWPVQVVRATEVMSHRQCYRVTFSDNAQIVCDAEHQWVTRDQKARQSAINAARSGRAVPREVALRGTDQSYLRTFPSAKTTTEIAGSLWAEDGARANHSVAVAGALMLGDAELPIDPYVLGAWLGDGHSYWATITCADQEIIDEIERRGHHCTKHSTRYVWGIADLKTPLRLAGLLQNKHVPERYFRASERQRLDLLRGLMDTDGHASKRGTCEFTSMSAELAGSVLELVRSLGMIPTMSTGRAMLNGKDCGVKYRVRFRPINRVFWLARKHERCQTPVRPSCGFRRIVNAVPVDSVPVKCIQVDSESHQYLCGREMIPTHNSVWLDALLINLARNFDWRLGICSPEFQPLARHEAHLIANYCGKPFGDGPTPRLTVQEKDFAKRWLATRFWFVQPEETTLDAVLERAEVMVKRYGINGFVLDPWNDLEDSRPGNMTETEYIHGALRRIRTFCRNHDVHFWIVAHPTKLRKGTDGKYPPATLYDINGSAGFFNKTDNGLSIYRDYSDDSVPVTLYIQKIKFHEVGGLGSVNFYHDRLTGRYWEAGYE